MAPSQQQNSQVCCLHGSGSGYPGIWGFLRQKKTASACVMQPTKLPLGILDKAGADSKSISSLPAWDGDSFGMLVLATGLWNPLRSCSSHRKWASLGVLVVTVGMGRPLGLWSRHWGLKILSDPGPEVQPEWSQGALWEPRSLSRDVPGASFGMSGRGQPGFLGRHPLGRPVLAPGKRSRSPHVLRDPGSEMSPAAGAGVPSAATPGPARAPPRRVPPHPARPRGGPSGARAASGARPAPGECERDGASSSPSPSRSLPPSPSPARGAAPALSRASPRNRGRSERRRKKRVHLRERGGPGPHPGCPLSTLGAPSAPPSALGWSSRSARGSHPGHGTFPSRRSRVGPARRCPGAHEEPLVGTGSSRKASP